MTGVDRPTRARSGGPWFTRPVAWLLAVGLTLGSVRRRRSSRRPDRRRSQRPSRPASARRRRRRHRPHARAPPAAPATSPIDAAERALVEGRFADVEALAAEPDAPASRRIVLARADAARGRLQAARERLEAEVAKAPTGDAALELGFVLRDMGRRDEAVKLWQAIVADRADERTPLSIYPRGPRARRARSAAPGERRVPGGGRRGAGRSAHRRRRGPSCSSTSTTPRKPPRRSRRRCRPTRAGCRRSSATPRRWPTTIRRRRAPASTRRWPSIRRSRRGAPVARRAGARRPPARPTPAPRSPRSLAVNPDQVEALSLQAAIAAIEDRTADVEQLAAARADAAARLRRRLPHHRRAARRALPLRGGGGAGPQGDGARARPIRARRPRSACTCCAPATRPAARAALDTAFRKRPVRRRHLQLAVDARHARPLRDDHATAT